MTTGESPSIQEIKTYVLHLAKQGDVAGARLHLQNAGIHDSIKVMIANSISLIETRMPAPIKKGATVPEHPREAIDGLLEQISKGDLSPNRPGELKNALDEFAQNYNMSRLNAYTRIQLVAKDASETFMDSKTKENFLSWLSRLFR